MALNSNGSNKSDRLQTSICVDVLLKKIDGSQIKYFDLVLIIPSLIFCIFLILHCRNMVKSVVTNNSSIINTFYALLCLACSLKVIRASVAMIANSVDPSVQMVDKALWLVVRFFLLATEMTIITFGVAAAKLDTKAGIRRVLILTSLISLTYTGIQAYLEFAKPDERFLINDYYLYGHGGALFIFISSMFFFVVYCSILILPFCRCALSLRLPTKRMFYVYCAILAVLYSVESVGSIIFYLEYKIGLCFIDFTTLVYFTCYDPLVFVTFLHNYLRNRKVLAFKYNESVLRNPETSEEFYKTRSNYTNSNSHNNLQYAGNIQTSNESDEDLDPQYSERSTHFYPDNLVTLDNKADAMNINQIMKNYNILSEGAQLEYASRCPSSIIGYEILSTPEDKDKSIILSLSEEIEPPRRETWDMSDFASQTR